MCVIAAEVAWRGIGDDAVLPGRGCRGTAGEGVSAAMRPAGGCGCGAALVAAAHPAFVLGRRKACRRKRRSKKRQAVPEAAAGDTEEQSGRAQVWLWQLLQIA